MELSEFRRLLDAAVVAVQDARMNGVLKADVLRLLGRIKTEEIREPRITKGPPKPATNEELQEAARKGFSGSGEEGR